MATRVGNKGGNGMAIMFANYVGIKGWQFGWHRDLAFKLASFRLATRVGIQLAIGLALSVDNYVGIQGWQFDWH